MEDDLSRISNQKAHALDVALNALDEFAADHNDADKYFKVQTTVSIYAQLCLLDKADHSAFAACELSKQHRLQVKLSMLQGLPHLVKNLDKFHVSSEDTQALKDKLDLMPQFKRELTVEGIKKSMSEHEITIDMAQKLFKMVEMQKENAGFDGLLSLTERLYKASEGV